MAEITTLLADDDYLVLQDLQTLVDWKALGFRIIGTASNGRTALEIARREHPDLVITDISMPVMDGFDFIDTLRKQYPDTYMILISSYADFGYAKRAIQSGVRSYILKNEVTADSLKKQLMEAREFLMNQTHRIQRDIRSLMTGYFRESLEDAILPEELMHRRYYFFFFTEHLPLENLSLHFQHLPQYGESLYQKLMPSLLAPFKNAFAITIDETLIAMIPQGSLPYGSSSTAVSKTFRQLKDHAQALLQNTVVASFLPDRMPLSEGRRQYFQLQRALHFQSCFPGCAVSDLSELSKRPFAPVRQLFPYHLLSDSLERPDAFLKALSSYLHQVFEARDADSLFLLYHNLLLQMGELSGHMLSLPRAKYFENGSDLVGFLEETYGSLRELHNRDQNPGYSAPVAKAIDYMKEHFSDSSLTVEQIAGEVFLSASRLSVLFRQETQQTVNDYLTDLRISHAVYLLSNSSLKIYEIAEKSGYKSSQYFSQVFQQKTGRKPLHFRQKKPSV